MKRIVLAVVACATAALVYAGIAAATTAATPCDGHSCIKFRNVVVGGPAGVVFHIQVCRDDPGCAQALPVDEDESQSEDYADGDQSRRDVKNNRKNLFYVVVSESGADNAADVSRYDTTIDCSLVGGETVQMFVAGPQIGINMPRSTTTVFCLITNTYVAAGAPPAPKPQGPDRFIYCSAAGDTDLNGNPLVPGTSLNLLLGQPLLDEHYAGATPGFWIPGLGVTCSLTPQQAALAAASTKKVNHVGGSGDYNQTEFYTLVG